MAFLAAAAPFLAAGGQLVQGVGGLLAGNKAKKRAFAQAREELLASNEQERESRINARRAIGSQIAAQWGNGFEGGTGSALDALRESQIEAALDAAEIRRQGVSKAESLRAEGKAAQMEGRFGMASAMLGAASTIGKARNDWAQARSGDSSSGGGG